MHIRFIDCVNIYSLGKDLFVSAIGAFIGILGALCIYFFQIRRQQNDKLRYAITLVDSIIPYIKAQADYCGGLSEKLLAQPSRFHLLQIAANQDLKRLAEKFDQEGFYHAYLSKYKRKNETYKSFKKIYSNIDFIDMIINQLHSYLEKENITIYEKKKLYSEYFEDALEKSVFLTVNPIYQFENQLINFLNESIVNYHQHRRDVKDLDYPFNNFITPVKEFLAHNYATNLACNQIVSLLVKSTYKYSSFILQSKELGEELKKYQLKLNESVDTLKETTSNLRQDFSFV